MLQMRALLEESATFPERGFEWYYWQRLSRVEHLTLVGHQGGVTAVVSAPDGRRLVTGGTDRTARVWDADSGRELFRMEGHHSRITSVAFAPDGRWLVTGSTDGTARIWDAADGRQLRKLQVPNTGPIWAVAVTPNGTRVITGSEDGKARVWDSASSQVLLTLQGPTPLPVLAASTVGLLNSPPNQGPVLAASVLCPGRTGHTGAVWAVAVSPEGGRLITGSADRTARIWDAESGRELLPALGHIDDVTTVEMGEVTSVSISANGQWLVIGTGSQVEPNGRLRIWDAATGRYLRLLRDSTGMIRSVALTPNGQRVVTGNVDGLVKVWDAESGREILTLMGQRSHVTCLALSPHGKSPGDGKLVPYSGLSA